MSRKPKKNPLIKADYIPAGLVARLICSAGVSPWVNLGMEPMLRGGLISFSLSLAEKDRLFSKAATLSDVQVSSLIDVFDDEKAEFQKLLDTDTHQIMDLQAKMLWDLSALAANRADSTPLLERAWRRRMLRQACRHGLKDRLDQLPDWYWADHCTARWAYRDLFEPSHPAWQD